MPTIFEDFDPPAVEAPPSTQDQRDPRRFTRLVKNLLIKDGPNWNQPDVVPVTMVVSLPEKKFQYINLPLNSRVRPSEPGVLELRVFEADHSISAESFQVEADARAVTIITFGVRQMVHTYLENNPGVGIDGVAISAKIKFRRVRREGGAMEDNPPEWWTSTPNYVFPDSEDTTDEATEKAVVTLWEFLLNLIRSINDAINYDIDEEHVAVATELSFATHRIAQSRVQIIEEQMDGLEGSLFGCGSSQVGAIPSKMRKHMYFGPGAPGDCFFEALAAHLILAETGEYPVSGSEVTERVFYLRAETLSDEGGVNFPRIMDICDKLGVNLSTCRIEENAREGRWSKKLRHDRVISRFPGSPLNLFITHTTPTHEDEAPENHVILVKAISKIADMAYCNVCCFWFTRLGRAKHDGTCFKCAKCNRPHNITYDCTPTLKRRLETPQEEPQEKKRRRHVRPPSVSKVSAVEKYLKNKYFLDYETFTPPGSDRYVVYSYSLISIDEVIKIKADFDADPTSIDRFQVRTHHCYCGPDALEMSMVAVQLLPENSVVVTYNGSRFDMFFIFQHLVENDIEISEILRKGKENKIITMTACQNKVKFWDMCLFTFTSLSRLCESVGVPKELRKQGFDHNAIRTWQDIKDKTPEIMVYNFFDVLCLGLAYVNFGETVATEYNRDITESCTLSQLAYSIWTGEYMDRETCKAIALPTTPLDYKWMRRGLFGGRCQPHQKRFVSAQYEDVIAQITEGQPRSNAKVFKDITDAKSYLDVSSLYPAASCKRGMFPMGKYKVTDNPTVLLSFLKKLQSVSGYNPMSNDEGLSDNKKTTVDMCLRSMFEVDITCPRSINVPFVLERGDDGSLIQDLNDKVGQVYDGPTILMAQYCGYKVTRIYRRVTWERLGTPLERFMEDVYKRKSDSPKASAGYLVWKLLMNSLTGKMSQQWITSSYGVYRDEESIVVEKGKTIESHELITHSKTGEPVALGVTIGDPNRLPSKPIHMGVWILSISRCMMMDMYMKMNLISSPKLMSAYGDTDSFIPPISALKVAMSKYPQLFGEKLGLLADEIGGGKIVRGWFISPKVYMVEYVTPDMKLKWKVRAKGIPRANVELDAIKYRQNIKSSAELVAWHHEDPLTRPLFGYFKGETMVLSEVLDDTMFEAMVQGYKVQCVYGSMVRRLNHASFGNNAGAIAFNPKCYRTVNAEDWWTSGVRSNPGKSQIYSVPRGHVDFKKMNQIGM